MPSTRIILLSIAAAIVYGILHDQVTARICIEYFTLAHPHRIDTTSPTLVAFYWGAAATWWVGALLGIPLAIVARAGTRPPMTAAQLVRPIGILLVCMAVAALISGAAGYFLTVNGVISIGYWKYVIPDAAHGRFMADLYSHCASYASGFFGGVILIAWTWRRRGRTQEGNTT